MNSRTVAIGSTVGLHARPAAIFVEAVTATGLPVTIAAAGGQPVDARSILAVMSLGAKRGESVTIAVPGEAGDDELDDLAHLLARDLDAE